MSGASRRLLWAATCLAALCVSAAEQPSNSSASPNVTTPTPTATSKAIPTTLTPTKPPGGPSWWGPAQHGRPAGVRRPGPTGGWGGEELGRGAAPAPRALPSEAPFPHSLARPQAPGDSVPQLGTATWLVSAVAVRSPWARRRNAPLSRRGAQTLGSRDSLALPSRFLRKFKVKALGLGGGPLEMNWLSLSPLPPARL